MPKSFHSRLDRLLSLTILLFIVVLGIGVSRAETLRISGTGDGLGIMTLLAEAFVRENPGQQVKVLQSVGSSGAIKGIQQQRLEIGVTSGPLKPEQRDQGLSATRFCATPIVFVVRPEQRVKALSLQQIADLFSGRTNNWPDGTLVRPIMRRLGESSFEKAMSLSPALDAAIKAAEQRGGLPYANSDQEMADLMERIPGAIGISTLGMMLSEKRAVVPLALDKVAPTPENAAKGLYPIAKQHYLITRENPSEAVSRFKAFVHSAPAQAILRAHGYWIP